jgi:hypothetical protein
MRFLWWITKAKNKHSEYVILSAFPHATCMITKQYFPTSYNTVSLLLHLPTSHSDFPLGAFQLTLNNTLQNIPHLLSVISHPQAVSSNSKTITISKIIFLYKLLYWCHSEEFCKRNSFVSLKWRVFKSCLVIKSVQQWNIIFDTSLQFSSAEHKIFLLV